MPDFTSVLWCCRKGLNFRPLPYQGITVAAQAIDIASSASARAAKSTDSPQGALIGALVVAS